MLKHLFKYCPHLHTLDLRECTFQITGERHYDLGYDFSSLKKLDLRKVRGFSLEIEAVLEWAYNLECLVSPREFVPRPRHCHKRLSPKQKAILCDVFEIETYPSRTEIAQLSYDLDLTVQQVRRWFVMKRFRTKNNQTKKLHQLNKLASGITSSRQPVPQRGYASRMTPYPLPAMVPSTDYRLDHRVCYIAVYPSNRPVGRNIFCSYSLQQLPLTLMPAGAYSRPILFYSIQSSFIELVCYCK
ncbi:hypothetical protein QZH41_006102 [Actinostola sp. cb2023]|nr:hypothetical protein QZH41_006102 [Actinostola sp. cb2023]